LKLSAEVRAKSEEGGLVMADLRECDQRTRELFETVRKSEESVLDLGRKCAKAVGDAMPVELPVAREILKGAFDFTEEVMKAQRDFVQKVLTATSPSTTRRPRAAGRTAAKPAKKVA